MGPVRRVPHRRPGRPGPSGRRAGRHQRPRLSAPGATVIWARTHRASDLTPAVRSWFTGANCTELAFHPPRRCRSRWVCTGFTGSPSTRPPASGYSPSWCADHRARLCRWWMSGACQGAPLMSAWRAVKKTRRVSMKRALMTAKVHRGMAAAVAFLAVLTGACSGGQEWGSVADAAGERQRVLCRGLTGPAVVVVHGIGDKAGSSSFTEALNELPADRKSVV